MNFIKVHNIEGGDLLINIDKVTTIYPRTTGGAVVNYFDGSTAPVTETVDELAALLLPGPVVIKELSPGAQERRSALLIVREFLEGMRESVTAECNKHESCEDCRNSRSAFLCGFRDLEDDEINAIVAEYNSEGQEAVDD